MLSKALETTISRVFDRARRQRYEFVTLEALTHALLEDPDARAVLEGFNANISQLAVDLENHVRHTTPRIPDSDPRETQPTLGFQRVLQRAVMQVQSAQRTEVTGAHVLAALFGEQDSHAVHLLHKAGVTRLDVMNFIAHGLTQDTPVINESTSEKEREKPESADENSFENFVVNLNQLAREGKIDPLIGRSQEIERVQQILGRRRKNNPLLVGEAGVGKTAIAEGLARKIIEGEVPEALQEAVVYSLDLGSLVAGTKYRGDFEKRLKVVLKKIKSIPHAILFIDEIHTLIGAGSASGGSMDASNLIKPALANGELRCIGSTTHQEYRAIFEKDAALTRRFQKVDIPEPSESEAIAILKGLRKGYEQHHGVEYSDEALEAAVRLASRHISDRHLPDKAIDVIDEAGAQHRLLAPQPESHIIEASDIERVVAKIARIPERSVSTSDREVLRHLDRNLNMVVFGQEEAIEQITTAIRLARSGLRTADKPIGSYLFAGPTGVGKTEVSKQLARLLGIQLVRFDMSEYMERHSVSRLIGAPPGYVGFDEGGLLTEAINKTPHAVLLLDEIEKAHPDVFNILLQVMDNGMLTDTNGRRVDFRNVILIMTSNMGAEVLARNTMGFVTQDHSPDGHEAIKRGFSPEFRNRLDAIVQFKSLAPRQIANVVDKLLLELEQQLEEKKVRMVIDDEVRQWLGKEGYDEVLGARPMARLIQERIKRPLAEELLFGPLADHGGEVRFYLDADGQPTLSIVAQEEPLTETSS
ncbi:ATP-dependent Clp protease ATP-binding subunit ClpA [Halothiobacillus diazotrophicus]|uniref:ATP-dependent Clp protease ATP-binding subunit ClpA n=2 Tax=Halothiobacillus TaxID=109262 RepID=A0A191ZJU1_9GAMM|nr:ATP-dependent Clp protease ATP-binding subunit ClpA [Halothiobacillus diazotrophicus]ANJ68117.1 ATP-dependent Clp protease ATP-binding subunit ClpA [Halothiobacillus diazotrophicus]